jgi:signal transduction histidine kinase/predicted RNA-binding protein with RPS1 domain/ActR/RegA family two-component response regulator
MGGQRDQVYTLNQRVSGKVEKILPYGVFVRMGDGTRAYIRRRELSWDGDTNPRELFQEGEAIEAVIIRLSSSDRTMELSLKSTLPDPWQHFIHQFRKGSIVHGTVKDLMPYGVFVEILPGLDGLVPLSELAPWDVEKPEDVVWRGDDVEAAITRIDHKQKKVWLSIRARMRQLAQVAEIMEFLGQRADSGTSARDELALPQMELSRILEDEGLDRNEKARQYGLERVGRILVVDDHDQVCKPLVDWLRHRGYQADAAKTPQEASEKIREQTYGLLLVGIDLPRMDGLALIRQIKAEMLETRVAIMSIPEWLDERAREIEELGVAEVFVKPLDLDEIERLLLRIRRGDPLSLWRVSEVAPQSSEPSPSWDFTAAMGSGTSLIDRLQAGIAKLLEATKAEVGVVFNLDPITQAVSILAQAGTVMMVKEAVYSLEDSPVRDVIREGEPIFENRVSTQIEGKFRKLLDLLPFESCIGVPIEAQGQTQHALFLFHRNQDAFHHYRLRDALAAATLFAAAIERETLGQRVQLLSKFLLSGQLSAGLGHELYNKMSALEIQLHNLQTNCKWLGRGMPDMSDSSEFREVEQAVEELLDTAQDLSSTVELFQLLTRAEYQGTLDVNEVLHSTQALLQPTARRNQVKIRIEPGPVLPDVVGSAIRLQQAFLNVMLNAVQQLALKSQGGGTLEVKVFYEAGDRERPIKVRFSDTGPGIHRQLWEKIFTLGFSTRPDGTGLGLFIARSLVESLGGKISVERSVVPIGTTFLVELPVVSSQEGAE